MLGRRKEKLTYTKSLVKYINRILDIARNQTPSRKIEVSVHITSLFLKRIGGGEIISALKSSGGFKGGPRWSRIPPLSKNLHNWFGSSFYYSNYSWLLVSPLSYPPKVMGSCFIKLN